MEPITTRIRKYFSIKYSCIVIINQADRNASSNKLSWFLIVCQLEIRTPINKARGNLSVVISINDKFNDYRKQL